MSQLTQMELRLVKGQRRTFSESFKRGKVSEIEAKVTTVSQIHKQYQVSYTSIYRWINKYSVNLEKKEWLIMEHESDTRALLELQKKVAELERIIGQKQLQLDFKDKLIEMAEDHYSIDIKNFFFTLVSTESGKKEGKATK